MRRHWRNRPAVRECLRRRDALTLAENAKVVFVLVAPEASKVPSAEIAFLEKLYSMSYSHSSLRSR